MTHFCSKSRNVRRHVSYDVFQQRWWWRSTLKETAFCIHSGNIQSILVFLFNVEYSNQKSVLIPTYLWDHSFRNILVERQIISALFNLHLHVHTPNRNIFFMGMGGWGFSWLLVVVIGRVMVQRKYWKVAIVNVQGNIMKIAFEWKNCGNKV